jgi:hypothetical protein
MKTYSQYAVKRQGKKDGRNFAWKIWPFAKRAKDPTPRIDEEEFPFYENEIFEVGESEMHQISKKWAEIDHKLKTDYCIALSTQLDAEKNYMKEIAEADTAGKDLEPFKKEYQSIATPAISHKWMYVWLFIIGIAELPLNSVAFQILGASKLETYVMTFIIGIILPIAAHYFGQSIRQDRHSLKDIIIMVVAPLVVISLISAISIFRETLFDTLQQNSILKVNMTPQTATILFIIINISVFFVATIVSYQGSHRNHEEFRSKQRRYRDALRSLNKESAEASKAAKILQKANMALEMKKQQRSKIHEKFSEEAKILKENYEWLVRSYRTANMSVRTSATYPTCFKKDPKAMIIPSSLIPENLDWECYSNNKSKNHENSIIYPN